MNNTIAIIDYGFGNITSLVNSIKKIGANYTVTSNPQEINSATKVIFPGVGHANKAMQELKKRSLIEVIKKIQVPFLGICLGMQLLLSTSEEGNTDCLNIIKGKVQKFKTKLKVPQIGWNKVRLQFQSKLFQDIPNNSFFYFVHSYYCNLDNKNNSTGSTEYGKSFCSALELDNFFGVQFHPEKSGETGLKLLQNFWRLTW